MPSEDAILDTEQVEILRQAFNEDFNQFIQTFLNDFEEKEKVLSAAIQNKEIDTIAKTAHFLKGSSLNMGAKRLGNHCYKIEMAGKQNNLTDATSHYQSLQPIYLETKNAFLELIK